MDIFFLDLVKVLNPSAHVATIWVDIPGVVLTWKYILASFILLSFGIGYLSINQL